MLFFSYLIEEINPYKDYALEKKMSLERKLAFKDHCIGLLGVSPIPIAGEICLSYFFYRVLDKTNLKAASIPAALLTRFGLYSSIYLSLYEKAMEFF